MDDNGKQKRMYSTVNIENMRYIGKEKLSEREYYLIKPNESICKKCGNKIKGYKYILKNKKIIVRECEVCKASHITLDVYKRFKFKNIINIEEIGQIEYNNKKKSSVKNSNKELSNPVDIFLKTRQIEKEIMEDYLKSNLIVYVYFKLNNRCILKQHNIITVTLKVKNLKQLDEERQINIYYCNECHKYWVNYEAVQKWLKMGFIPKIKLQIVDELWSDMKPVSKLMLYGYDVKANHLSEDERHDLLAFLIDNNVMKKYEIIRNIQAKVSFNGAKAENFEAKKRWENDIDFVSNYLPGNLKEVDFYMNE